MTSFPSLTPTFHHSVYPAIDPTNPALTAKGKIVLITGGGRGLGKAIAHAFVLARAQAVVILGRSETTLQSAIVELSAKVPGLGYKTALRHYAVDVVDTDAVNNVIKSVREELGPIDTLISNAGDLYMENLESCVVNEYWKSLEINIKGTLNCIHAFINHGIDPQRKQIPTFINLTTMGIHMGPLPGGWSAYSVGKLAAWKMVEYLRMEQAGKLRAFSVHPGRIPTDMAAKAGVPTEDTADLPAGFCVWLVATSEADFLGGRMLWANWDVDELLARREEIVEKGMLQVVCAGL